MIVSFNEFLESTTGYSYTELINSNWFDLLIPKKEKAAAIETAVSKALEEAAKVSEEDTGDTATEDADKKSSEEDS